MATKRRFWVSLALLFVATGLLAPRSVSAQGSAAMAVDAIPGGAIDSTRTVAATGTFDIDIVVTAAPNPYLAYQYKLGWDPAVLTFDSDAGLAPAGLELCGPGTSGEGEVWNGCIRAEGTTTFTGPVHRVTLHCLADGTSPLHLISTTEDPTFGTTLASGPGIFVDTSLTDAQVTCGEGGAPPPTPGASPTPGGPGPTPSGPAPTATPLPPGMEAVDLVAGCNAVASTYPDATPTQTIASNVGRTGILTSVWKFDLGSWLGYSPQFPEVSDLTETEFLDALFICVDSPGAFVRPIV